MHIDMTEEPLYKNFVLYFLPLLVALLVQNTYSAADMIILGQFAGDVAVAAVGATSSIVTLVVQLFMGVAVGYNIVLLRLYGAEDKDGVKSANSTALIFSLGVGVLMMVVGMIFAEPLLRLTNCPEEIIADAALYARIYFISLPATMFYNHFSSLIKAGGDTTSSLVFIVVSGITNIILNLFFILVVKIPVAGVAIATTVSIYVSALMLLIKCLKVKGLSHLELRDLTFSFTLLKKYIKHGLPSTITNAMSSFVGIISSFILNSYGPAVIAGSTSASSIISIAASPTFSMASAATSFMSQNIGAKKKDNVFKIKRFSLLLAAIVSVVLATTLVVFAEPLLTLYLPDSPEAVSAGALKMYYNAVTVLILGFSYVLSSVHTAYGKATFQMVISASSIAFNVLWLLVIYKISPSLDTLFLYSPVAQALTLTALFIFERIYTKQYLKGAELTI